MSSLANAIKRKTNKERAQPAARRKYGLLEKHKDYVLRAKDFHKKEKAIKDLKRKAEERNPDEFYFAMEKATTRGGVHDGRSGRDDAGGQKYSAEELALMKTQDVKYLSLKAAIEAKKIERLRESHQFIGVPSVSKHTVFVDSRRDAASFSPAQYFDTVPEAVGRKHNRPRRAQLESGTLLLQAGGAGAGAGLLKRVENKRAAAYKELTQRAERHDKVAALAAKLAYEKEVAGRGRKRKLAAAEQDGRPQGPVYKWKRERKR